MECDAGRMTGAMSALPALAAAHESDGDAFDRQRSFLRIDDDRREIGIFGDEQELPAAALQALDRDLVAAASGKPRDDDLPRAGVGGAVHGEKIAVEDAGVPHALAAHAQQVVGARREQRGIEPHVRLDVLGGENRVARGDATDERQSRARQLRHVRQGAVRATRRA